ncbi:hypothetical protein PHJA_000047500 [Phtheirospermum japonicum]|uniref:FAF domain-containing protein n=1 Tax=Phtheirospermum japonicum TaxID=374723 RepID=A0A830AWV8_9LAMI|nr:hypothetical protein PHJA_000047500 [Phtheirospermum japonicum]
MPWVMKRYYSGDGRLVITEERVRHHEYFQVYRSNGRLVLNLVPLNDVVEEEEDQGQKEETEAIGINGDEIDGADGEVSDPTVGELVPRCYTYNNGLGVNTCGGFAAFRPPVHT